MGRTHTSSNAAVFEEKKIISQGPETRTRTGVPAQHYSSKCCSLREIQEQLMEGDSYSAQRWTDPSKGQTEKGTRPLKPRGDYC